MIYSRHNNAITIIHNNDNYTVVTSIKDYEHEQRTAIHTNLPNVYPKEAEKFPTPTKFKQIMLKSENLQKLLKHRFKATAHVEQAKLIYCEGYVAEDLTTGRQENDFAFQQVEPDTKILSAFAKLRESYNGRVNTDSEDADVYVQAAYVAHDLPGDH